MAMPPAMARRLLDTDLISAKRMPVLAARVCEIWVKRELMRIEDRAAREVLARYQQAYRDIREMLYSSQQRQRGQALTRAAVMAILPMLQARTEQLGRETASITGGYAAQAYTFGYYSRGWLLDMMTREDVPVRVRQPDVRAAMERLLLREAGGDTAAWRLIAEQFGDSWWQIFELEYDALLLALRRILNQGIREGLGMADVIARIGDKMGIDVANGGGNFGLVQAITRTYIMDASNQGAAEVYNDNQELLAGMEHLTARDERVCPQCRALDGQIYPMGAWEVPPRNTHPNCRCTVVPRIREDYQDDYLVWRDALPRQTFSQWIDERGVGLLAGILAGVSL